MGIGDAEIPRRYKEPITLFFEANSGWVFGHAFVRTGGDRERAEDLVQDTFMAASRAWRTLRKLTEKQQRAWLCRTLANIDISDFRKRQLFRRNQPELYRRYQPFEANTPDQALNRIALQLAAKIIEDDLSGKQKRIALMRWNDQMKLSEIAAAVGCAEGTVAAHLHDIRHKLMTGLGPFYPFSTDDGEGGTS
jgi:RNA polymerase sigma factor (sigma-70 family)